jgi:hypothetical protein
MSKTLERKLATWTGLTLDTILIIIAIVLVLVVLFVHNKYLKAAIIAYEVLP